MKITGRHMVVTPALRQHVAEKFDRLERYAVPLDRVEIVLEVNKLQHAAEAICVIGGKRVQAKTSTREMYATIDQLVSRLEAQIRKFKERRTEHKSRPRGKVMRNSSRAAETGQDIEVVRPKLAVLSRHEAKNELDEKPGSLMLFTCAESGKLQILRRTESGQVVLIDP